MEDNRPILFDFRGEELKKIVQELNYRVQSTNKFTLVSVALFYNYDYMKIKFIDKETGIESDLICGLELYNLCHSLSEFLKMEEVYRKIKIELFE